MRRSGRPLSRPVRGSATCRRRRACCRFCATVRRRSRSRRPAMRKIRRPHWLTCWPARVSPATVHELQWHRIRWPLMSQEEADRRELNTLLNDGTTTAVLQPRTTDGDCVSPVRKPGERWTERLQWLLMTDGFGFRSPLSREAGAGAGNRRLHGAGGDGASGHGDGVERRRNRREALSPLSSASHVHPGVSGTRCKTD